MRKPGKSDRAHIRQNIRGVGMAEYSYLLVMIALLTLGAVVAFGNEVRERFEVGATSLSENRNAGEGFGLFGNNGTTIAVSDEISVPFQPDTKEGDLVVLFVMHRSSLTTPPGWTVESSEQISNDTGTLTQFLTVLSKTHGTSDGNSINLQQASEERFLATAATIRGSGAAIRSISSTTDSGDLHVGPAVTVSQPETLLLSAVTNIGVAFNASNTHFIDVFPRDTWALMTDRSVHGNRLGVAAAWGVKAGDTVPAPIFAMSATGPVSKTVITTIEIR